jgi:type II secretory ATPase GspE/PulE/Tfp pilus assembly ATPase PilB-like protein
MDEKTPEWVFDQDDDELDEGKDESASPSSVSLSSEQEESQQATDEAPVEKKSAETTSSEDEVEEHKPEILAEDGSVIEEVKDPIWEEEPTVFEDEENFIQTAPPEEGAVKETATEEVIEEVTEVNEPVEEKPVEETFTQEEETPPAEEVVTEPEKPEVKEEIPEVQAKEDPTPEPPVEESQETQHVEKSAQSEEPSTPPKKEEPIVAGSTFESAGWDMFGGTEPEVEVAESKKQEKPPVDDSAFMSQLDSSKEVEETQQARAPEPEKQETIPAEETTTIEEAPSEPVEASVETLEETKEADTPAEEKKAERAVEKDEEKVIEESIETTELSDEKDDLDSGSVLDEESVLGEVDALLETDVKEGDGAEAAEDFLQERDVEDLNAEVEALLSPVEDEDIKPKVATGFDDEGDGSLQAEEVFKDGELVLKRDEEKDAKTSIVENAVSDDHEDFYVRILETLESSEDLGLTPATRGKIRDAIESDLLPQIAIKELISQRVIGKIQLARAATRSQGHKEIMSFLDIPQEATLLRKELDPKAVSYLREHRIIPISRETSSQGKTNLSLAYESTFRDLVKESDLKELLPDYKFSWHFALREVCGAFWLSGDDDDVDSGMEAEALLDRIVTNAIDARSSDIHIDPSIKGEPRAVVKYRIDGFVTPKEVITQDQLERLRVRIENIARMPKVNQNHPNKGAFSRAGFDWRVQIQPHAGRQGAVPRIVIRRLQPDVLAMETLGYPQYFIDDINAAAASPNGVIFWTGPTGSGKTESIHSAIVSVNPMGKGLSVHTIEDPPEKRVSGYAVQMEMSDQDPMRSGMELLKSSLRADPDVVIFGEVRDEEMAGLVFEAANTGHLVFSTLHTNTALDAIVRLDELGIYGFLVSYIRGIAAQRLVRRLCVHCKQPLQEMDDFTKSIFDKYDVDTMGAELYKANPEGCASCNHSGYHGRIAICEWLTPNKELVEISTRREYDDLERVAIAAGWKPMAYMGVLHVKNGITDAHELASKVLELSAEV